VVAAIPVSRWVGWPMRVHGSIQGVRVEARVALELEEGRWKVERTDELQPVATASAAGRLGAAPGRMRGRRRAWGVRRPKGAHVC
jgi:hypothetical protein